MHCVFVSSIRLLELVWALLIDQLLAEVEHATTPVRRERKSIGAKGPLALSLSLSSEQCPRPHV